LVHVCVAVLSL
jgi:hypothetical protein